MSLPVAVITGAGRGIGRATALAFARRGYACALLSRSAAELDSVGEELRAVANAPPLLLPCDVSNEREVERARDQILAHYTKKSWASFPSVVVNNAGIVSRSSIVETSLADWSRSLDVNLTGAFLVSRAFLPSMLAARQGRIVHVASISSTLGTPKLSAYCASKWGLLGFMKSMAEELRGTGLQTMAVLPGSVDTQMLEGSGFTPQMSPSDVAKVIVHAALDAPDAMNGSAIEVFGP
jgi:3-oxoacyl-[acyl-carrier protein] reductase